MTYPRWRAPTVDGEMLLWSPSGSLTADSLGNRTLLDGAKLTVGGVALGELRRQTKAFISVGPEQIVLMTGHQVELHHAGVWVKNAIVHAAAERLNAAGHGARAVHLAVDTDQPKHLAVRFPVRGVDGWQTHSVPLSDEPMSAAWSGLLDMPSPVHLASVQAEVRSLGDTWGYEPLALEYLETLRHLSLETGPLVQHMTHASHRLEWSLGLRHDALLASGLWGSPSFLLFFIDITCRAVEFAGSYNAGLAEYRRERGISSPGRPMPDLSVSATRIELPFWLDNLSTGRRSRPVAVIERGMVTLELPCGDLTFNPESVNEYAVDPLKWALRTSNCRISPRALTLTLFCRLFLADLFLHGIGGGEYDQVTDRIIRSFFGMTPPAFAVATATLRPAPGVHRTPTALPPLVQRGHHLSHGLLGPAKAEYLARIAALPRGAAARRAAFFEMHAALRAARQDSMELAAWQRELSAAASDAKEDPVLLDRELFFALHSRERLETLMQSATSAVRP